MLRGEIPLQVFNHRRALFLLGLFFAGHFPYRTLLSAGICSGAFFCHSLWRGVALCATQHCLWPDILCGRLRKDFGLTVRACSAVVSGWGRSAVITPAAGSLLR